MADRARKEVKLWVIGPFGNKASLGVCKYHISMLGMGGGSEGNALFLMPKLY